MRVRLANLSGRRSWHRAAAKGLALVLGLGAVVAVQAGTAPPALAGSISCDNYTPFDVGPGTWHIPTVGFNSGNTNCVLGVGNNSIAVTKLQDALRRCNGQNITVDGDYGPHTRQAVINVQNAHHIPADGVYGPQTESIVHWPLHDFGGGVSCTIPD